jgi:hypothetical protein
MLVRCTILDTASRNAARVLGLCKLEHHKQFFGTRLYNPRFMVLLDGVSSPCDLNKPTNNIGKGKVRFRKSLWDVHDPESQACFKLVYS